MAEFTAMRNVVTPYPIYGLPYVVTFPLLDADGDPITPSSPDSEISKNGDTFADCTNEAVEIATSSGTCYLSLTGTELTTDVATVQIKSTGAKTTVLSLPIRKLVTIRSGTGASAGSSTSTIVLDSGASDQDDFYNGMIVSSNNDGTVEVRMIGDYVGSTKTATLVGSDWVTAPDNNDAFVIYRPDGVQVQQANATMWLGATIAAADTAGYPKVTIKDGSGAGEILTTSGKIDGVILTDTVTTYTGNTPQTGDSFARIGATGSGLTSLATQTSVNDVPTNAELATALGTADDATLAAIAALNNLSTAQVNAEVAAALATYDGPTNAEMVARTLATAAYATAAAQATAEGKIDTIDTVVDAILVDTGTTLQAEIDGVQAVTDKLNTALELDGAVYRYTANALEEAPTGGSAPTVSQIADEVQTRTIAAVTLVATTTNLTNAPTNGDFTATMKASINTEADTALADYDAPTNAELTARTLASADYATAANLAIVSAFLDTEIAAILAAVDTEIAAIKAKTDLIPASPAAVGSEMILASTGLDNLSATVPTTVATTFREKVLALWQRFCARVTVDKVAGTIETYQANGTTVATTQLYTSDASADEIGVAS